MEGQVQLLFHSLMFFNSAWRFIQLFLHPDMLPKEKRKDFLTIFLNKA
jgi:hypothetical protein